jgi:hypothetical protein
MKEDIRLMSPTSIPFHVISMLLDDELISMRIHNDIVE